MNHSISVDLTIETSTFSDLLKATMNTRHTSTFMIGGYTETNNAIKAVAKFIKEENDVELSVYPYGKTIRCMDARFSVEEDSVKLVIRFVPSGDDECYEEAWTGSKRDMVTKAIETMINTYEREVE